jgi:hypothetical protein
MCRVNFIVGWILDFFSMSINFFRISFQISQLFMVFEKLLKVISKFDIQNFQISTPTLANSQGEADSQNKGHRTTLTKSNQVILGHLLPQNPNLNLNLNIHTSHNL